MSHGKDNTDDLLRTGTRWSIAVVVLCVLVAAALCGIVIVMSMRGDHDELVVRLLLSCIACFIGMALGCLGFSLFLIQAKGSFNVDGTKDGTKATLATNAPGLVVVVCSTIVIALALNIGWTRDVTRPAPEPTPAAAEAAAAAGTAGPIADGIDLSEPVSHDEPDAAPARADAPPTPDGGP